MATAAQPADDLTAQQILANARAMAPAIAARSGALVCVDDTNFAGSYTSRSSGATLKSPATMI